MFGALISGLVSGFGAVMGAKSQSDATKAAIASQERMSEKALALQEQMYKRNRRDLKPWRDLGTEMIPILKERMDNGDFDPGQFSFGMDKFQADPGYQFRLAEGQKALERTAAARGNLLSGAQLKAAQGFGQDLASQEYQNAFARELTTYDTNRAAKADRFNRLASLAGTGQQAVNTTASLGANMANQNAQNLLGTGRVISGLQAQQGQNQANMWSNLAGAGNQMIENLLLYKQVA